MTRQEFIETIKKLALNLSKTYPINPIIVVAQACLESRYGESKLAKEANNLFGIKAFASWKGQKYSISTNEWEKGKKITIIADFRKYDTLELCLADYCKLISTSKYYKEARDNCKDYLGYAKGLKAWATDPDYITKLIDVARKLNLIPPQPPTDATKTQK